MSASALTLTVDSLYIYGLLHIWGGRSSAGRALDCGSSGRGFKSRRSPSGLEIIPTKSMAVSENVWNCSSVIVWFWRWSRHNLGTLFSALSCKLLSCVNPFQSSYCSEILMWRYGSLHKAPHKQMVGAHHNPNRLG